MGGHEREAAIRRLTDTEARAIWRELNDGAWSIVERFDDGTGRRFVLARHEGERPTRAWHRLSRRQRTIVARVAAGKGNRAIAAELGISVSSVASHLRAARKKLDGARRIDLVREWAASSRAE